MRRKEEPGGRALDLEADVRDCFNDLADAWEADTLLTSSSHELVLHPAYQSIMSLGPRAVPAILDRLSSQGGQWFWALHHMTGAKPVNENASTAEARAAWLAWGREHGLIER